MVGPLAYIGGKNRLAKQIIEVFPEHTTYVEAFSGGAQVLFHKEPSKVEVINDLDGEVVNFFRVCQRHAGELIRTVRPLPASRRLFAWLSDSKVDGLTDIERAARFFYLQKNAFGGLVVKQNYHWSVVQRPNYDPARVPEIIEATRARLERVQIESLPYEQILSRYDRPTTLFYLDPPYFGRKLYRFNFEEKDFVELARRLARLRGRFVLSLNDVAPVRRIFSGFRIASGAIHYSAQKTPGNRYGELLITNF
ncbi:MAG: DNA adenine methylase [Bryobacteraceae bacterium]